MAKSRRKKERPTLHAFLQGIIAHPEIHKDWNPAIPWTLADYLETRAHNLARSGLSSKSEATLERASQQRMADTVNAPVENFSIKLRHSNQYGLAKNAIKLFYEGQGFSKTKETSWPSANHSQMQFQNKRGGYIDAIAIHLDKRLYVSVVYQTGRKIRSA